MKYSRALNVAFLRVLLDNDGADFALVEGGVVDVVLRGDPTDVDVSGVLAGEDPHAVEVLVHQLEALTIEQFVFPQLLCGTATTGTTLEAPSTTCQ